MDLPTLVRWLIQLNAGMFRYPTHLRWISSDGTTPHVFLFPHLSQHSHRVCPYACTAEIEKAKEAKEAEGERKEEGGRKGGGGVRVRKGRRVRQRKK